MDLSYHPHYASIPQLREKAKKRIPRFAFDYLDGGCNDEVNLQRNTAEIRDIQLKPFYLRPFNGSSIKTTLFGHEYDAPFGVAPIGLQGLMWPKATEILAKAAFEHNIPFVLSTVATASIETVASITQGQAWFQLYHPKEDSLRDKLLDRAEAAGIKTLVVLTDVPTFGYRPKEIKNGLSIPPKMTFTNIRQILGAPNWALQTLLAGQPQFATMKPYIPKGLSLKHLGLFMNKTFDGRLNEEKLKALRDKWKGNLVIKGLATPEDAVKSMAWGMDGIIVSNHGGRQLDCGESTIKPLVEIAKICKDKTTLMMDSGMRSGPDIANCLASGAAFTFLGRPFMYGVSALGHRGGSHTISILKIQLQQVLDQLCCEGIAQLPHHLI
ncbi:alpha-hydroxy-acid oxidizing protein [bacterium]|nr:alpha-hydroxy-acid oxidizing protein [bacterium]